jgi:hypothetical protein
LLAHRQETESPISKLKKREPGFEEGEIEMTKTLPTRLLGLLAAALSILLVVGMFTPGARADEWNKLTKFTFSGPVQIPGFHGTVVLPAGTYVFRLLDIQQSRNIVLVYNSDQTKLLSTIMAIPNYRLTPTSETVVTFAERPEGTPPALKAWFYPGDTYGQEFVYPKSEAVELAKEVNEPVLSMPEQAASNLAEPTESAEAPSVKALEKAPVMAEEPSGEEVPMGEVAQTAPQEEASNALPATASEMPLAALVGMLLLGMGLGLRRLARNIG